MKKQRPKKEPNVSNIEARTVAVETEDFNDVVVAEMANGEAETVPKPKEVSIEEAEVVITEVHARTKMALSSRVKSKSAVAVEAEETTTESVVVEVTTEANEVVIAATTVVVVTGEAEIVPKKRVRLNRLSNNNKLSELDRAVVVCSGEIKITYEKGWALF